MLQKLAMAFLIAACAATHASAQDTLMTSFNTTDFSTGSTADVTLTSSGGAFTALFSGGVQEQSFHGPAYNSGPAGYFFINGTFTGASGRTLTGSNDIGSITFSAGGVDNVSFFAGDFANGTPTFSVLGLDGSSLLTQSITGTSNQSAAGATAFSFDSTTLGQRIGAIEFDNAGPASNPPYVIAIDSFSASVVASVPEPTSGAVVALAMTVIGMRRRR